MLKPIKNLPIINVLKICWDQVSSNFHKSILSGCHHGFVLQTIHNRLVAFLYRFVITKMWCKENCLGNCRANISCSVYNLHCFASCTNLCLWLISSKCEKQPPPYFCNLVNLEVLQLFIGKKTFILHCLWLLINLVGCYLNKCWWCLPSRWNKCICSVKMLVSDS